jgi:hypothetical protein
MCNTAIDPLYSSKVYAIKQAFELLQLKVQVFWNYCVRETDKANWAAALRIDVEGGPTTYAFGQGHSKKTAREAACANIYPKLPKPPDWNQIYSQAQAGDVLIKLSAMYLDATPYAKAQWLAKHEADRNLRTVFDRLLAQGEPGAIVVKGSTDKDRATYVEALVWERFSRRVLRPSAAQALQEIRELLE